MQTYRDLVVWQKSKLLVKAVYQLTEHFPKSELFGLMSQMRRAAISISANIAEGYARKHRAEYVQFLRIAFGSGAELEILTDLADELGFSSRAKSAQARTLLDETMRMLNKMISSLVAIRQLANLVASGSQNPNTSSILCASGSCIGTSSTRSCR